MGMGVHVCTVSRHLGGFIGDPLPYKAWLYKKVNG